VFWKSQRLVQSGHTILASTPSREAANHQQAPNTSFYWSDGLTYGFNFGDPRGMMNFVGYNSQTRQWDEWH